MKSSIARDTIFLTAIQLGTQGMSLILNIFVSRMLGTENLGLMSLIYTFFGFAMIISNGNIFVSTSRFVAEECGKAKGNPEKIFRYALIFSLILSFSVSAAVFLFAEPVGMKFIHNKSCVKAIRVLAVSLPLAASGSCMKGYFHAYRMVVIPALGDAIEFLIKSCIIAVSAGILIQRGILSIYSAIAISIICGEAVSFLFLSFSMIRHRKPRSQNKTSGFLKYIIAIIPVILNSYIPCILSTANDALVPVTLKQSGCSTPEALSWYGIFEAVVLPVLFFPSMFLSCLSVILIPEISKQRTNGNTLKNLDLISSVIGKTIMYSVFVVSILIIYGNDIGMLISREPFSGKMIMILSPVIPFIYLEIVLEGIIKGMGRHSFSSVNYLAEYIIRISTLLIFVPVIGFYGIAVSYYMSNIICNISRIVLINKINGLSFSINEYVLIPVIAIIFTWQCTNLFVHIFRLNNLSILPQMVIYTLISFTIYIFVYKVLKNIQVQRRCTA